MSHSQRLIMVTAGLILSSLSCKYLQDGAEMSADEKACRAQEGFRWQDESCQPPPEGYLGSTACAAIKGAHWEAATCRLPKNDADCRAAQTSWVWDGRLCVSAATSANFFRLCTAGDGSPELQHTMRVMSRAYQPGSCQELFDRLWALQEMSFQGDSLTELSPLAGFSELRSLNLWNNKISDPSPLASLSQLTSLNLGHNRLTNLDSLAALSALSTLILSENDISDIAPLSSLAKLEYLDVSHNHISDLEPLRQRTFKRGYFDEGNPPMPTNANSPTP